MTGASLHVFLVADHGGRTAAAPTDSTVGSDFPAPPETTVAQDQAPSSSWTLTSAATVALKQSEPVTPAVPPGAGEQHGDFFPLADFLGTLNLTSDAAGPYPSDVKTDDPNLLERIIDMIRDALFLSEDNVPDVDLAAQLSALEPAALLELERHLMDQAPESETTTAEGIDDLDG